MGLLVVTTLSSYYWDLYQHTEAYDLHKPLVASTTGLHEISYDNCMGVEPDTLAKLDLVVENDTHWTIVFYFNAIVYTMLSGMIVCSFAGLVYSQLFQVVLSCMQITQIAHFVGVILAGVYRFKTAG